MNGHEQEQFLVAEWKKLVTVVNAARPKAPHANGS
jgi:hypothetical protein